MTISAKIAEFEKKFDDMFAFNEIEENLGINEKDSIKTWLTKAFEEIRLETIEECLKALPEEITDFSPTYDYGANMNKLGFNACREAIKEALENLKKL